MNVQTIAWNVALLGQATAEGVGGDAASPVSIQSIWDFARKGGPMMIPIGLFSLAALTVIIERFVTLRRRNIIPPDFLPGLKKALAEDGDNRAEAVEYCRENGSPIANIFAVGIRKLSEPIELLEKYIEEAGRREIFKLRKYLRMLSVVASVAPLMGLLGTIFGMIVAFQTVATSGEALGKAELLAKGIYQAMITTAGGLLLAIPVLIAYHYFCAKIDHLVAEMDLMTLEFVEQYADVNQESPTTTPKLRATGSAGDVDEESDDPVTATASA